MEFKLNKIDTDIRKKMQEEAKDDKVHSSDSISVKKDLKEEKSEQQETSSLGERRKRYFTIDGVKCNNGNISVNAVKIEKITQENFKGRILDKKK